MYMQTIDGSPSMQEREMLIEILMNSDLYLELSLKERLLLFKYIFNIYSCLGPTKENC